MAVQTDTTDHAAHHRFVLPSFTFEDGTTLPNTVLSYGTYGRLNDRKDNVIPAAVLRFRPTMAGWSFSPSTPGTIR